MKLPEAIYNSNNKVQEVDVYICKTDYEYHIPDDIQGITVYFSEKSIREERKCVKSCGIVKMKLTFESVVQKGSGCYRDDE